MAAGCHVVLGDIDGEGAREVAASLVGPGSATGVALDVTDAEAVAAAVEAVVDARGSIDLMFNNAGITLIGDSEQLSLEQWNSIIDINIRGVVNGVAAAYPRMITQRSGQIVNTASAGGLMAAGLLTSYVMTKHAVVGLSLALRTEAADHGVGVTVVCPGAVETPILEKGEFGSINGRDYYLKGQGIKKAVDPDLLAAKVLDAVVADKPLVIEPVQTRFAWRLNRFLPGVMERASIRYVAKQRRSGQPG